MTVYVDSAFHPYGNVPYVRRQLSQKRGTVYEHFDMDHEAVLFEYYKRMGKMKIHYCPSWDFMVIHSLSPEFQACTCDKVELR